MRPISRVSFPDIEPAIASDERPRLAEVDPSALLVDERYQRNLSERSARLIRKILAGWDWRVFKPPVVVEVDGEHHVVDGQHTAIAAVSHPAITTIPVMIISAEAVADRAQVFVKQNADRIVATPLQLFHAQLAAEDEDAMTVQQVCDRAGIRILKGPPANGIYRECETVAIASLKQLVNRRYAVGARKVLEVLAAAQLAPVSADQIKAVEMLLTSKEYRASLDPADVAATLRTLSADLHREARIFAVENHVPVWRGLVIAIFRKTRKKRRGSGSKD